MYVIPAAVRCSVLSAARCVHPTLNKPAATQRIQRERSIRRTVAPSAPRRAAPLLMLLAWFGLLVVGSTTVAAADGDATKGGKRIAVISLLGNVFRNHQIAALDESVQKVDLSGQNLDERVTNILIDALRSSRKAEPVDISTQAETLRRVYDVPVQKVTYPVDHDFRAIAPDLERIRTATNVDSFLMLLLRTNGEFGRYGYGVFHFAGIGAPKMTLTYSSLYLVLLDAKTLKHLDYRFINTQEQISDTLWANDFNALRQGDRNMIIESVQAQILRESSGALKEMGLAGQ